MAQTPILTAPRKKKFRQLPIRGAKCTGSSYFTISHFLLYLPISLHLTLFSTDSHFYLSLCSVFFLSFSLFLIASFCVCLLFVSFFCLLYFMTFLHLFFHFSILVHPDHYTPHRLNQCRGREAGDEKDIKGPHRVSYCISRQEVCDDSLS